MSTAMSSIDKWTRQEYKYGFVTEIEADSLPPGLNEDVIRVISAKKDEPEFMLRWRLKAYRHWLTMKEPTWANIHYPPIDYQAIVYYSAPKQNKDGPKSLDEVDPKLLETYEKLGIPLQERAMLAALDGSCRTPIGGLAEITGNGDLTLRGLVARPDGSELIDTTRNGPSADAENLGREVGEELRQRAGPDFFE